jgi:SAM-dependent methyltransferase
MAIKEKEKLKFKSEWYKQIVENSNEKTRLANFIKNTFLQQKIEALLEIGMGIEPIFSNILSEKVGRYVIIEKESVSAAIKIPPNVQIVEGDFENKQIEDNFDLIILSHVIYYFLDLESAIQRAFRLLNEKGKLIFIVNEISGDYAHTKEAFAEIAGITFTYTYDLLKHVLQHRIYEEHTVETYITFDSHANLYEYLRLFFDLFPNEYSANREKITRWLKNNINGHKFYINQKVIVLGN